MTVVIWVSGIILSLAAMGTIYRMWRGPTLLDRVLAADVLLIIVMAVLSVNMVAKGTYETLLLLVVLSMVGFIGSVTVARFADNSPSGQKRLKSSRLQKATPRRVSDTVRPGRGPGRRKSRSSNRPGKEH